MSYGKDSDRAGPVGDWPGSDRWVTGLFLLLLFSMGGTATYLLFLDCNEWVLVVALVTATLLLGLEHLEISRNAGGQREWNPTPGCVAPMVIITLATFVVCFPALNSYFSWDDFAYVQLFHTPSLTQFLRLFRTDLSQGVWGINAQELRPLYGLSYMLSYSLWGIHPLGYHLSGILLHIMVSFVVFLVAKSFCPGESWRAGFAGLLFAVLPAHSMVVSWANGSLTEAPPTLFYVSAFLCFVSYRRTNLTRYLALSTTAFSACLLSKETAITLPFMLVSYDLFRMVGEGSISAGRSAAGNKLWRRLVLPHLPFIMLLLGYLEWRRIVFSRFLREETWLYYAQGEGSGLTGFLHQFAHVVRNSRTLEGFNIRNLLIPFPASILGLVLGLFLVWAVFLLTHRSDCRRSMLVILYFGLVWNLISNLPLLAIYQSPHHLYLPSVGFCIATAFLAVPVCTELCRHAPYLRLLGATLLLCLCACQLWKENAEWACKAKESASASAQLAAALEGIPKQPLVIIWPVVSSLVSGWGGMLPFALQRPFTSTELYSPLGIIEPPCMYSSPDSAWREKTQLALRAQLTGPSDDKIQIYLLAWDEGRKSFQRKKCVLSRGCFEAYVTKSLAGPVEKVRSLGEAEANELLEALAKLVSERS
jgi:uncharacterized membrane protein